MTDTQLLVGALSLIGAGVGAWMRVISAGVADTKEKVAVIHTALVGVNGDNGINSEVKAVRARSHALGESVHVLQAQTAVLRVEVDDLKERLA